jgi:hypothetical protein
VISPSDVVDARDEIERTIADWNAQVGPHIGARVEAVRWERHSRPELGDHPQDVLNRQLVDDCDLGIAVFWSRAGTPTLAHDSGSVEEIERLHGRGAPVCVYFSSAPIPQVALRDDQFERLMAVRKRYETRGLLGTFATTAELGRAFQLHLTDVIAKGLQQGRGLPPQATTEVAAVLLSLASEHRGVIPDRTIAHRVAEGAEIKIWVRASDGTFLKERALLPEGWWAMAPWPEVGPPPPSPKTGIYAALLSLVRSHGRVIPDQSIPHRVAEEARVQIWVRVAGGGFSREPVRLYEGWLVAAPILIERGLEPATGRADSDQE